MTRPALLPILAVAAATCAATGASAADSLGTFGDWAAYADGKGKARTCWIYSEPKKDEGKYAKRGRIYVLVTHRPGEGTANQVQFTAGYDYKQGSAVTVKIGPKSFELFTNDDSAWARDKAGDDAIVAAMRAGSDMIVTGTSSRGTETRDTYSLSGISAAHDAIGKACKVK
jgi:hypothetical protein